MASIATLSVSLVANTSRFSKGLRAAVVDVSSASAAIGKAAIKATALGAAFAGGAAAGAAYFLKRQAQLADALGKTADRLGLGVGELQAWSLAATLAGSNGEVVADSFQELSQRLGEAARGQGEAREALDTLGLSIDALMAMNPSERFRAIADALSGIQDPAMQAATAAQLFGDSGVPLLNMLRSGSAALEDASAKLQSWGVELTRVDVAKIEAARRVFDETSFAIGAAGQKIAAEFSPYVEAAAREVLGLATENGKLVKSAVSGFEWMVTAIAKAADWLSLLKAGWRELQAGTTAAIAGVLHGIDAFGQGIEWLAGLLPHLEVKADRVFKHMADALMDEAAGLHNEAAEAFDAFTNSENERKVRDFFNRIEAEANEAAEAIADEANRIASSASNITDTLAGLGDDSTRELQRFAESIIEQTRTATERFESRMQRLREAAAEGLIDDETFRRAVKMAEEELARLTDVAEGESVRTAKALGDGLAPQSTGAVEQRFGGATAGQRVMAAERETLRVQRASYDELRGRIAPTLESMERLLRNGGGDTVVNF